MNGMLGLLFETNPWYLVAASGIFIAVVASVTANFLWGRVKRRWDKDDHAEEKEKTGVQTSIAGLGLQLATEREERRSDLNKEARERRDKDDDLGCDIQDIRQVISNDLGSRGKSSPHWRDKK